MQGGEEEELLRSVAIQNAKSILLARQRSEQELLRAKQLLERKTQEQRATLQATWDGILVTDEQGRVTDSNRRYVEMWRMPSVVMDSLDHRRVLEFTGQQFADPGRFLARIEEIHAQSPHESLDVLELADGRVFERYSRPQIIDERYAGRVWSFRDITANRRAEEALRDETRVLEILNRTGSALSSNLDLQAVMQAVTDAATEVSGAGFGAFFYNTTDENGDAFMLCTLCGARQEDFAGFRHFGYQLTFFRIGLTPTPPSVGIPPVARASDFATSNIYMAHFALTDVANQKFYAFERFSRGAAGLAGAQGQPFRVWLEDWDAAGVGADGLPMRLQAAQNDMAIDLTLAGGKPVVLQGDGGVSQVGTGLGKAYYYYSLTRMPTSGIVTVGGQRYDVSGLSWMDHEFGTGALDADAAGWDWFALQLDDGRELMYAQLRAADGQSGALNMLIESDGSTRQLAPSEVALEATGTWTSPRSGGRYPAGWRLRVPSQALDLTLTPYLADQELPLTTIYWEGAVKIAGTAAGAPISGNGYVELTGYGERQGEVRVR